MTATDCDQCGRRGDYDKYRRRSQPSGVAPMAVDSGWRNVHRREKFAGIVLRWSQFGNKIGVGFQLKQVRMEVGQQLLAPSRRKRRQLFSDGIQIHRDRIVLRRTHVTPPRYQEAGQPLRLSEPTVRTLP
jgi:hypothetical protein